MYSAISGNFASTSGAKAVKRLVTSSTSGALDSQFAVPPLENHAGAPLARWARLEEIALRHVFRRRRDKTAEVGFAAVITVQ
jgi:hypothetical protein